MNLRNFIKNKRHSAEAIENSRENGERVLAACVIMEHFDNPKMACVDYQQSAENLKSYMQRQWNLVRGMAGTFREIE